MPLALAVKHLLGVALSSSTRPVVTSQACSLTVLADQASQVLERDADVVFGDPAAAEPVGAVLLFPPRQLAWADSLHAPATG